MQFVIPGLTRNLVFFWIPAGVYPVLDTGREWRPLLWLMSLCIVLLFDTFNLQLPQATHDRRISCTYKVGGLVSFKWHWSLIWELVMTNQSLICQMSRADPKSSPWHMTWWRTPWGSKRANRGMILFTSKHYRCQARSARTWTSPYILLIEFWRFDPRDFH